MQGYLQPNSLYSDGLSNDIYIYRENEILADSIKYYNRLKYEFRPEKFKQEPYQYKNLISKDHLAYLNGIKAIFDKHNTNYNIVISPLYFQKPMDIYNVNVLKEIFGKDHVFDYSGDKLIIENRYNYWESSHYRYKVGEKILMNVYSQ